MGVIVDRIHGTTMPEWLARRAHLTPAAPALFYGERAWTFAELDDAAVRAAQCLRMVLRGAVGKSKHSTRANAIVGPRVALLLPNNEAFVVLVHAAAKAGTVLVPLNARLTPKEMAWQLADAGATVLIHDDTSADVARTVAKLLTAGNENGNPPGGVGDTADDGVPPRLLNVSKLTWGSGREGQNGDGAVRTSIALDDVHSIVYTSGTTGKPKGAMLTYGNHWWSATGSVLNLGLVRGDSVAGLHATVSRGRLGYIASQCYLRYTRHSSRTL